ncbi:MAG: 30S ribosomal protein S4 [Chloroflexota bacterium]
MDRAFYPSGDHGRQQAFQRKQSDYKRQLMEKQKLRAQYNITERQLRNYYKKAVKKKGNTGDNLVKMLEMRLDAVVLRGGLARTIYAARQYVSHKHITVNGQRVNVSGYTCKVGDVIAVREKSRKIPCFIEAMEDAQPIDYLALNQNSSAITVVAIPEREQIPVMCELSLVIEFYSR